MSAPISISGATVGSILELLSFIISYMDNATLASMARVSKMASAPALSTLWSDMDALGPLLRLLHPSLPAPSSWDLDLGTFHSTGNVRAHQSIIIAHGVTDIVYRPVHE
jgi:hypothetical protein